MYATNLLLLLGISSCCQAVKKCCPPDKTLHPHLKCGKVEGGIEEDDVHTFLMEKWSGEETCVSRSDYPFINGLMYGDVGMPKCSTNKFIITCGAIENVTFAEVSDRCDGQKCFSDEMCVDEENNVTTILSCNCLSNACIRKCCPDGEILNEVSGLCVRNDTVPGWRPKNITSTQEAPYYLLENALPTQCETLNLLKVPEYFYSESQCQSSLIDRDSYIIKEDGYLHIGKYGLNLPPDAYCGEHTIHEDGVVILNNVLLCLPKQTRYRAIEFDIYGILLILGGCFLFFTMMITCYLPELWSTFYHKVTICHNAALMIANFTWGITNLLSTITYSTCVTLSLIIQFTFLASFFWMNVMCIDITLAFKNLRSVYGPVTDKGWISLLWYSLYAWGAPLLLTSITAFMELSPNVPSFIPRPGFGCGNCGFDPATYAILIYLYGPMMFILVFNTILFTLTLMKIRKVEKQTDILKGKGKPNATSNRPEAQRFLLFVKMFVLMGLTWTSEVVSWWVGGSAIIWYIPDLINILRAFFLCFLFIGKRSVLLALKKKLTKKKGSRENFEAGLRRSKSSSTDRNAEIERRGRILARQITQTIRLSTFSTESQQ